MKTKLLLTTLLLIVATSAPAKPDWSEVDGGTIAVLSCGDSHSGRVAVKLGASGNALVHVIAGSAAEVEDINRQISRAGVKGLVTVEELGLQPLPYRDFLINTLVIMDPEKARASGLTMDEARRCLAPLGKLVTCRKGKIASIEEIPIPEGMDVWTHRYYQANGLPTSRDTYFDLPVGFKWNAGLPNNFDNPERGANRYSSTRALVVDDARIFTFSTGVYENLGDCYKSTFGTDQYLTCRDAFNGRFLWRKRIGDTYYGGLYVENTAPLISTGRHLYLAAENGKMLKVDTRTGETVMEMPTAFIPGVIAADDGIVVTATWKDGYKMGAEKRWDRRRMDYAIDSGTIEAYEEKTGKRIWKQDYLGTSLLVEGGRVFIVSRNEKDDLELNFGKQPKPPGKKPGAGEPERPKPLTRPENRVMAFELMTGKVLWETDGTKNAGLAGQSLNLEAAAHGAVVVAQSPNRSKVELLSAETGQPLSSEETAAAGDIFFRYRKHVCTPSLRVNCIELDNRGGNMIKDGQVQKFTGARGACLTGTVPAYGAGYISQNWCNCTPGQIKGLMAIAPIGTVPTPAVMEQPAQPVTYGRYDDQADGVSGTLNWSSFRGNALRDSSSPTELPAEPAVAWSSKVASPSKPGTVQREWLDYLNSRLTAPVIANKVAIVGDIDHNEVIAVNLENGEETWRFSTGGRMNTAPTLFKGICLVGDHTGYVYALKVKSGQLVYKLRIAPEEKRMLSYGKIESVWPVVGGVLVNNGKAYASCGRTQGSDGGLLVRAFQPETGKPLWARAVPDKIEGVTSGKPKRNDALVMEAGLIRLMDHYLDPDTGNFVEHPRNRKIDRAVEARLATMDGPAPKGRALSQLRNEVAKGLDLPKIMTIGNEGIYSWNWKRLAYRKFGKLAYDNSGINTVAWSPRGKAFTQARGAVTWAPFDGSKGFKVTFPNNYLNTSIVICNNAIVHGGEIFDSTDKKGFIRILDIETGNVTWEKTFASQLAFNGLAVDRGMILASLNDGSVVLLK